MNAEVNAPVDVLLKSVHVIISGRVQGVWFRGWTKKQAHSLNIRGWVRNRRDGTVEAVFAGVPDDVDAMLAKCWKGPPVASVKAVRVEPAEVPKKMDFIDLLTV
ncbi:MAG: acylphosphatase [Rhodospirillaceae bacterium]|jgi:acylphosphatase|nr:acylphosphatase [Rhodospirillaceae bacterium]